MRLLRSVVIFAWMAVAAGGAQAGYIVDTGEGAPPSYSLYDDGFGPFQSLGATFSVESAYTITSVEGWIAAFTDGDLVLELIAGGSPDGSVLFSTSFAATPTALGNAGSSWQGAAGLDWNIVPGVYTLAISAPTGFFGAMAGSAPNPLAAEWFRSMDTGGIWTQADGLDIGIRIDALPSPIPEPGTLVLLGIGLAGLADVKRRSS